MGKDSLKIHTFLYFFGNFFHQAGLFSAVFLFLAFCLCPPGKGGFQEYLLLVASVAKISVPHAGACPPQCPPCQACRPLAPLGVPGGTKPEKSPPVAETQWEPWKCRKTLQTLQITQCPGWGGHSSPLEIQVSPSTVSPALQFMRKVSIAKCNLRNVVWMVSWWGSLAFWLGGGKFVHPSYLLKCFFKLHQIWQFCCTTDKDQIKIYMRFLFLW